jgi:Dehydrogenases with different specificities (related to short-chain alcohol dehydrogenases)
MSSAEYSMASLSDIFRLDGKVAVVVGGAGGIGKFLVEALSAYGAKVVIADLVPLDKSKDLARKISERTGREIGALQFDATDEAQVAKARDEVVSKYGTVDILVNSQGINIKYPALEFPVNDWDRMYAVNVKSLMLTSREFGRVMVEKRYGKIINMSSVRDSRATKWGGQHSVLLHEGGGRHAHQAARGRVGALRGQGQRHRPRAGVHGDRHGRRPHVLGSHQEVPRQHTIGPHSGAGGP